MLDRFTTRPLSNQLNELSTREKLGLGLAAIAGLGTVALGMTKTAQEYVGVNNTDCVGTKTIQIDPNTPAEEVAQTESDRLDVPKKDKTLILKYKNGKFVAEGPDGKPVFTENYVFSAESCN